MRRWVHPCWAMLSAMLLAVGCASTKALWNSRLNQYSFDQAVLHYGPPDKSATLSDGTRVSEWLLQRGYVSGNTYRMYPGNTVYTQLSSPSPDYYLRLTFDTNGTLRAWKKVAR